MKILFHNIYQSINENNNLFTQDNTAIGDNLLSPFKQIATIAADKGVKVGTNAIIPAADAEAIVFIDYPGTDNPLLLFALKEKISCYLILLESPIVSQEIFRTDLHMPFEKVFTWSDKLVDSNPVKYVKINYSYEIAANFNLSERQKDYIIIAGNKKSNAKNELYSDRLKCIKWFETNASGQLDLYGFNWDLKTFNSNERFWAILNTINEKYRIFKQRRPSYRGKLNRKYDVLPKYKFSICLENVAGYDGYVTEKIFDCFFSGTIPIYKGAPNIQKYIPKECFIDFDDFASVEEMYRFTQNLKQIDIQQYQSAIKGFLESEAAQQFSNKQFANTILTEIVK